MSRSSALASKATGYPIAKLAAKLAVGYTLDELPNYITSKRKATKRRSDEATEGDSATAAQHSAPSTQHTPGSDEWEFYTSACFEPTIDYCVIKIPRWTFEKFPDADETLTTQMKSVGEAMAIGRTFKEALQKGIRSMEVKRFGFGLDKYDKWLNAQKAKAATPNSVTGVPPVQGGLGVGESNASNVPASAHGRDARATSEGRAQTFAPQREPTDRPGWDAAGDRRASVEDASDKTTQGESLDGEWPIPEAKLRRKLSVPSQGRLYYVRYALKMGWTIEQVHQLTKIDPWFLAQMKELVDFEDELVNARSLAEQRIPPRLVRDGGTHRTACDAADAVLRKAKQLGYSDVQLANVWGLKPSEIRDARAFIEPVYKIVDTCAAEFEASTPYYYSTYEQPYVVVGGASGGDANRDTGFQPVQGGQGVANSTSADVPTRSHGLEARVTSGTSTVVEDEIRLTDRPKVIIIGGGPNRIGQGIEFDYCCVHAAFACRELGLESVMINSNPETVSTDYDTSDLLFFEPLTHEDILNICERLNGGPFQLRNADFGLRNEEADPASDSIRNPQSPIRNLVKGVIVQFGGQTPLNLAKGLKEAGVPILGTSVESLDAAGDREQFRDLLQKLGLKQPPNGIARSVDEARKIAAEIGYPVLVRPSFVLGGRAMEIVYGEDQLNYYMANAVEASTIADAPILIDKFLDNATECDVDCVADYGAESDEATKRRSDEGEDNTRASSSPSVASSLRRSVASSGQAIVIGVMEHIEEAGIHSGDSACALPPFSLPKAIVDRLKEQTKALAKALRVRGLMNVQYAIKDDDIYVIEVNPRASRTVPFVGKATGVQWAKIAAKVMCGKTLAELGVTEQPDPKHVSVKEVVFPFSKFPGVDIILGPEMRSTGEAMGIDDTFALAFAKSQLAVGTQLPTGGTAYVSVRNEDKEAVVPIARQLVETGFKLVATGGTFDVLKKAGIEAQRINKLAEGRPHIGDLIKNGDVKLMINTPTKKGPQTDEGKIRAMAVQYRVPIFTTLTAASAGAEAIAALARSGWDVKPLQAYHG